MQELIDEPIIDIHKEELRHPNSYFLLFFVVVGKDNYRNITFFCMRRTAHFYW